MGDLTIIPAFDGLYAVTDDDRLFSVRSDKYLRTTLGRYGYLYYVISINSVRRTLKAHRLVAQAFIPNPDDKPTVNHKNGIRLDNCVDNLEWATALEQPHDPLTYVNTLALSETTDYAAMGAIRNFGRKRTAVYRNGLLFGVYDFLLDAAKCHKVNYSKASECAKDNRKMTGGFKFAYVG